MAVAVTVTVTVTVATQWLGSGWAVTEPVPRSSFAFFNRHAPHGTTKKT
jgi:hypothetical protein